LGFFYARNPRYIRYWTIID